MFDGGLLEHPGIPIPVLPTSLPHAVTKGQTNQKKKKKKIQTKSFHTIMIRPEPEQGQGYQLMGCQIEQVKIQVAPLHLNFR